MVKKSIDAFVLICVWFAASVAAGGDGTLWVGHDDGNKSHLARFHGRTGQFMGLLPLPADFLAPKGIAIGPDGHVYVTSGDFDPTTLDRVYRFDSVSGEPLGVFADGPDSGSLNGLDFGPDGHLYVCDRSNRTVRRYDGQTGAFLGLFVPDTVGTIDDVQFGPDGHLYAATFAGIRKYDGRTGAFLMAFGVNGLFQDLAWSDAGSILVSDWGYDNVTEFDPHTGALIGVVVSLNDPFGIDFDAHGDLYVCHPPTSSIRQYTPDGELIRILPTLPAPRRLAFVPHPGSTPGDSEQ